MNKLFRLVFFVGMLKKIIRYFTVVGETNQQRVCILMLMLFSRIVITNEFFQFFFFALVCCSFFFYATACTNVFHSEKRQMKKINTKW